uniref:Uncharacterized protein n=1 Tax=virus sp. ctmTa7 TaxID=2828255 RepID=A0A8S5RC03_9VIRU|nr:MAG TPA: hypothetical protein [virus sp. ctmTa7]
MKKTIMVFEVRDSRIIVTSGVIHSQIDKIT